MLDCLQQADAKSETHSRDWVTHRKNNRDLKLAFSNSPPIQETQDGEVGDECGAKLAVPRRSRTCCGRASSSSSSRSSLSSPSSSSIDSNGHGQGRRTLAPGSRRRCRSAPVRPSSGTPQSGLPLPPPSISGLLPCHRRRAVAAAPGWRARGCRPARPSSRSPPSSSCSGTRPARPRLQASAAFLQAAALAPTGDTRRVGPDGRRARELPGAGSKHDGSYERAHGSGERDNRFLDQGERRRHFWLPT